MNFRLRFGLSIALGAISISAIARDFEMTLLHTNDMHAHVEAVKVRGKEFGGYARLATLIKKYLKSDKNVLLLDAGDVFQGTLYFNVYEGLADLAFMNEIGYHAMAVGNHEFDLGPPALGEFARRANFPILASNLDVSAEPILKDVIKPFTIVTIGGQKIGVVGLTPPELPDISNIGKNIKMIDNVAAAQASIDTLTSQGINKIVVLSHSSYTEDLRLSKSLKNADIIVGGHSHSYLAPKDFKAPDGFPTPQGLYPTVTQNPAGHYTLVVQSWEWGKLLGRIKVTFDDKGKIKGWRDGAPILVDDTIAPDPKISNFIAAFQRPILAAMNQEIAQTDTGIDRGTTMRELLPDAMLSAAQKLGTVAAFMNTGGVRAGLEAGKITLGKANEVQPFRNTLVILELTGQQLKDALETPLIGEAETGGLLMPSKGTSYAYDMSKPSGNRVSEVVIAGAPLELTKTYRLAFNSFTAAGGDAHTVLKSAPGYRYDTGLLDIDILVEYLKANTPVNRQFESRVKSTRAPF